MVVAHNLAAMNAQRQYKINGNNTRKNTEKLSSGYQINRAADDAAGLAISEKMRKQIRGLDRGADNMEDGISLAQVTDGALNEVTSMLQRMNVLCVQAANGTLADSDRKAIESEINEIKEEIDRVGETTKFNDTFIFRDLQGGAPTNTMSLTNLISSPSTDKGRLSEGYQMTRLPANTKNWYTGGSIDFSMINEDNIDYLEGAGFSFACGLGCGETFEFKMTMGASHCENLSGSGIHQYTVSINGCTNGAQIVDRIFEYVKSNPPVNNGASLAEFKEEALSVSHNGYMAKAGNGNKLVIFDLNTQPSKTAAEHRFDGQTGNTKTSTARVECTSIAVPAGYTGKTNNLRLQCSSEVEDWTNIQTHEMNCEVLGLGKLTLLTEQQATKGINIVKRALATITEHRSEIGAYQNRMEHAVEINRISSENTTAAESRIRDTDMAEAMVEHSKNAILNQASEAMIAQANSMGQQVLALLQ